VTDSGPLIAADIRSQRFVKYVRGKPGKRGMGLYFVGLWPKPMVERSIVSRPRWDRLRPAIARPRLEHLVARQRGEGWGKVDPR
jgi:hypothetical protein